MRLGIVGAGRIGKTAATLFAAAGHEVALSNAHGPDSLRPVVADLPGVRAATVAEAAEYGECVLLALPWRAREELDPDDFAGQLVIDATNPYTPEFELYDLGEDTSSEVIARYLPDATVVKAFNTLYWETLRDEARPDAREDDRLVLFLAGDDTDAKRAVADLIRDVGFTPVDTGPLRAGGRKQEPGSPVYDTELTLDEAKRELAGW